MSQWSNHIDTVGCDKNHYPHAIEQFSCSLIPEFNNTSASARLNPVYRYRHYREVHAHIPYWPYLEDVLRFYIFIFNIMSCTNCHFPMIHLSATSEHHRTSPWYIGVKLYALWNSSSTSLIPITPYIAFSLWSIDYNSNPRQWKIIDNIECTFYNAVYIEVPREWVLLMAPSRLRNSKKINEISVQEVLSFFTSGTKKPDDNSNIQFMALIKNIQINLLTDKGALFKSNLSHNYYLL